MSRIAAFGRFWFDFVVGDDWRLAAGVVAVLALVHAAAGLWWVLPLGIAALLAYSVNRAAAAAKRDDDQP
jgi:hypothetical protein